MNRAHAMLLPLLLLMILLQALEKLSHDHAAAVLREGGLMAVGDLCVM
jgi:hypothetical protein